ncbi:apolipoprotein D and lipocalin family protein [Sphingobacterium allocomposti]|uniref:Apolipoprotein D and lipocalin family protein n=1 Tax=Sphingobacterium allocomposti TaxID=415956 RepID=A0A5S5DPI1_9SPHI|nr:lipocalin family protein [Sphingobacterium composti Yoo et al. 2007 non Ten et al. 2007]TYP97817.1 apolipoprotein D and lipocalin family protein [Sphingobacterium composti Yoo et al. 2007 non Ten et al. 2007]
MMDKKKSLLLLTAVAAGTTLYNVLKPIRSNVSVVQGFEKDRYLGEWYEIARLDFRWERNLKNVIASYSLNDDGTIQVHNQGYDIAKAKYRQSTGKVKFVRGEDEGALKVSFFGPFYAGYNVVMVEENYQQALVFGQNLDYMWILSRTKDIPPAVKEKYLDYARRSGYAVDKLVWTVQD